MRNTVIVLAFLVALTSPAFAQTPQSPVETPTATAPTPITEVESLRMQVAQLVDQVGKEQAARHEAEKAAQSLRLQLAMLQAAPVREGYTYDWSVGKFREVESGKVWDFTTQTLVADDKTPKPDPAKTEKGGGGL